MKKKIWIVPGVIILAFTCFFIDLFVIGEPVDGNQLAYTADVNGSTMELRVSAAESAVALRGWKVQQEGSVLSVQARKVLVSPLFPSGESQTAFDLDGITRVYLGGKLIWDCDERVTQ